MAEVHVKGLAELDKLLKSLPAKIEANIMRGALRAGNAPFLKEARARVASTTDSGLLRDSIRITTRRRGSRVQASTKAGGKGKRGLIAYHAHLIEYTGAKAHKIKAKDGGVLFFGGKFVREIDHPGMRAVPFMRPSFHTKSNDAIRAVAEYVKRRLATKHGIDTAHIIIEGDE